MDMNLQRWFVSENIHGSLGIITSLNNYSSGEFRYLDCYLKKNLRHAVRMEEDNQGEVSYYFAENGKETKLSTPAKINRVKRILAEKSQVVEHYINQVYYRYPGEIKCARFRYEGPNKRHLTILKLLFDTQLEALNFSPKFDLGESINPEEWSSFQIWKLLTES